MTKIIFLSVYNLSFLWICCSQIGNIQASCQPNPCKNGGICTFMPDGVIVFCLCPKNFTGSSTCDPSVTSTRPATTVVTSRLVTMSQSIKSTEETDSVLTSASFHRTTATRRMSHEMQSTDSTTSRKTPPEMMTEQPESNNGQSDSATPERHRPSTTKLRDEFTSPLIIEKFTKMLSLIITKESPTEPTKLAGKSGNNYHIWFTWIVILLFVTSVLLLILAIALYISYGRVYDTEDEENDPEDYPPEEEDCVGKKHVFTLNFRN
ncbi:uncharacterized protein [Apostichopus japonicus]|uniref:uncharacterized protein n=1 Tax=Stichopus japonicus TaxID=307972 RepID=UPI003AB588E3